MFKCQECNKSSKEGETPFKKLLETRPRTYQHKEIDRRGRERLIKESVGWEIAREISVCGDCIIVLARLV